MGSRLRNSAVESSTLIKYSNAVNDFILYCDSCGEEFSTAIELDFVLASYLDLCFDSHLISFSKANETVYGIELFLPHAKHRLRESYLRLRGWRRQCPSISKPPLTFELTVLISITMLKSGYVDEANDSKSKEKVKTKRCVWV